MMYPDKYFTPTEARDKVGRAIRTKVNFSGVVKGTTGKVVGFYHHTGKSCGVEIQWDLLGRPTPLVDGFSKDEYVEFLEEIHND